MEHFKTLPLWTIKIKTTMKTS